MKYLKDNLKLAVSSWQLAKKILLVFIAYCLLPNAYAQNFPTQSNPPRLVNDFANVLSSSEKESLERKLVAYDDSTSTQIAIVTIESLEGRRTEV